LRWQFRFAAHVADPARLHCSFAPMTRPGTFILLWGLLMVLFGSMCMRLVPPGGVSWPFFGLAVAIPVGSMLARRRRALAWQVVLYALVMGPFFSAGVVFDGREDLRVRFGQDTEFALWARFVVVAAAVWLTTALAAVTCARGSRGCANVMRHPRL
jgi:uncharacterized membrane protein YhaH (DUF805 family)